MEYLTFRSNHFSLPLHQLLYNLAGVGSEDVSVLIKNVPLWLEQLDEVVIQRQALLTAEVLHLSSAQL